MSDERWQELAEQVQRLTERLDALETATPAGSGPVEVDLWAIEGLRQRAGAEVADLVLMAGEVATDAGPVAWQWARPAAVLSDPDADAVDHVATRLAALGSPVRLRLVLAVLRGRTTVAELTELEEMGTSGQIYHHIRSLTAAGWLRSTGRGRVGVPPDRVVPLLVAVLAAE
ncbi:ArsR/SmtB family transcription factor [Desertihabitans aurantiacus]|uniref:ArsR/SmtB family transcription factor n=1 Tax=Desertihabitans aurantiacus TaxID=2282477 RepID=UPI000DF7B3C5|nr:winged helix-turn-helix domain-containing protein [Desertihabitans aurantiacus]